MEARGNGEIPESVNTLPLVLRFAQTEISGFCPSIYKKNDPTLMIKSSLPSSPPTLLGHTSPANLTQRHCKTSCSMKCK